MFGGNRKQTDPFITKNMVVFKGEIAWFPLFCYKPYTYFIKDNFGSRCSVLDIIFGYD